MVKMLTLSAMLVFSMATATTVYPSKYVDPSVKLYPDAEIAKVSNYKNIEDNINYQELITHLPTEKILLDECHRAILSILKSPATAKFSSPHKPVYAPAGKMYETFGKVDAQNSFGALLRSEYGCKSVFQGDKRGGYLYTWAYLSGQN